jgi:ATP/maltotriose-dependent transcriptional regulator MalT
MASWLALGVCGFVIDQSDMLFTRSEAIAVACASAPGIGDAAASEWFNLTAGWPAAFLLAINASVNGSDVASSVVRSRQLIFEYIREQVFEPLADFDKEFLTATCMLPSLDVDLLPRAGFDSAAQTLLRLSNQTRLLSHESDRVFRCNRLFSDFLKHRLELRGRNAFRASLLRTASILEAADLLSEALSYYSQGGDQENVRRMLLDHGRTMLVRGSVEEVRRELFSDKFEAPEDVRFLALRAEVFGKLGRFDESNSAYRAAVRASSGDQSADFSQRLAASLVNQYRQREACRLLSAIKLSTIRDRKLRCRIGATLAAAQSAAGRHEVAAQSARKALSLASRLNDRELHASTLNCAAFVAVHARKFDKAATFASKAADVAEGAGLHGLAARAYSTLTHVSDEMGDRCAALDYCTRMLSSAERSGEIAVARIAIMGLCDLAVERGEAGKFSQLEARLEELDGKAEPRWRETLLPARALQLAWLSKFADAESLLSTTPYDHATVEQQLLRRVEIALYAAAAGNKERASSELVVAQTLERKLRTRENFSYRVVKATFFATLAYVLVDQPRRAVQRLRELQRRRHLKTNALYALWRAAMIFVSGPDGSQDDQFAEALRDLRDNELGGMALLLSSLLAQHNETQHRISTLTATERLVLQTLARGQSTKSIALELGRSPSTIDTHVKAILRKLGCRGRIEAARIARDHGFI